MKNQIFSRAQDFMLRDGKLETWKERLIFYYIRIAKAGYLGFSNDTVVFRKHLSSKSLETKQLELQKHEQR